MSESSAYFEFKTIFEEQTWHGDVCRSILEANPTILAKLGILEMQCKDTASNLANKLGVGESAQSGQTEWNFSFSLEKGHITWVQENREDLLWLFELRNAHNGHKNDLRKILDNNWDSSKQLNIIVKKDERWKLFVTWVRLNNQ